MTDNQSRLQIAMAVGQQTDDCKICKLDIDCFEELFDWLTLVDLHSVGQTCKRLRQYAGYIFRQTYPGAYVDCKNGGIFIGEISVNGFCEFIENLSLGEDNMDCFNFVESKQFKSLKRIEFHNIAFTDKKIDCIKHILMKGADEESVSVALEDVQLFGCTLDGDFHEKFLQYCPNLKRLSLKVSHSYEDFENDDQPLIGDDDNWMFREYPKLESFGLGGDIFNRFNGLRSLFTKNPNIRKYTVDPSYGGDYGLGFEVDVLSIICYDFESAMYGGMYRQLSEEKFFKRLQLYGVSGLPFEFITVRPDVKPMDPLEGIGALEKLHYRYPFDLNSFAHLKNLENLTTLCIWRLDGKIRSASAPTKLERIFIHEATLMQLKSFIVHLPKLHTITIDKINSGDIDNKVMEWSRERERLPRACKVTVYVPEAIYLAVKLAAHATDSKLVELKRLESYEWDHDFGYPQGRYFK